MVIGIAVQDKASGTSYDYMGVPYPEGYINENTIFLFIHKDIEKVDFVGFVNFEYKKLMAAIEKSKMENKSSETSEII